MESSSPQNPDSTPRLVHRARARRPLVARKRFERQDARRRIAVGTRRRLTSAQLAFDPLTRANRTPGRRLARILAAILASLVLHAVAVGFGIVWRSRIIATAREEVKIEVHQRAPEPPPEKIPPPPVEKPTRPPPKLVKAPPPEPPPPANVPKPVRVIGLSLESTTEGGSGPAFAVGNTRRGETAERAVASKDVSAVPDGVPAVARGPSRSNQVASHIPVAGVNYQPPKARKTPKPTFPATLHSQGIEADVTVVLTIDVEGKVTSVKIIKEAPYPEFNEAVREAVAKYEYEPATRDGVPIPYSLPFTVKFRLEDE